MKAIALKNTRDNPLVLVGVSTTPGESLRTGIKITPKDIGFFDEVVYDQEQAYEQSTCQSKEKKGMSGNRTKGRWPHPTKNVQANSPKPLRKEVYDGV